MRFLVPAFILFSTTSVLAQGDPPSQSRYLPFTTWQLAEFAAYTKKCFHRQREPIRNQLALSVTIGPDGMIIGEPEVVSPIDSDDFRADVTIAVKKLRQCQPFIVDPFGRVRVRFTQVFRFGFKEANESISAAVYENFKKCWMALRTGPTIWVDLSYKPDGTYQRPPLLVNPENTEEYSHAAAEVMRQINKCPPVTFPKDKYPDRDRSIRWQFPSYESARASKSKT